MPALARARLGAHIECRTIGASSNIATGGANALLPRRATLSPRPYFVAGSTRSLRTHARLRDLWYYIASGRLSMRPWWRLH